MQALGALRPQETLPSRPRCVVCGRPLRPGKRKFCSPECRFRADQNARQALSRRLSRHCETLNPTSLEMVSLAAKIKGRQTGKGAREEETAQELAATDALILKDGLSEGMIRAEIWLRASVIRLDFLTARPTSRGEFIEYARALEVLRDIGIGAHGSVSRIRRYGWEAIQIYRELKEYPALVRALIAYGNPGRLIGDLRTAHKVVRAAEHIVKEKCDLGDRNVLAIRHNTMTWSLRYFGQDWDRDKQEAVCKELLESAETPAQRLEAHRELASFWNHSGDPEKALEHCNELENLLRNYPFPNYGKASLRRPKIEAWKILGRRDEMIDVIEEYFRLYESDRNVYHFEQLAHWKKQYGLGFQLPPAEFGSGVLTYLPRSEMS